MFTMKISFGFCVFFLAICSVSSQECNTEGNDCDNSFNGRCCLGLLCGGRSRTCVADRTCRRENRNCLYAGFPNEMCCVGQFKCVDSNGNPGNGTCVPGAQEPPTPLGPGAVCIAHLRSCPGYGCCDRLFCNMFTRRCEAYQPVCAFRNRECRLNANPFLTCCEGSKCVDGDGNDVANGTYGTCVQGPPLTPTPWGQCATDGKLCARNECCESLKCSDNFYGTCIPAENACRWEHTKCLLNGSNLQSCCEGFNCLDSDGNPGNGTCVLAPPTPVPTTVGPTTTAKITTIPTTTAPPTTTTGICVHQGNLCLLSGVLGDSCCSGLECKGLLGGLIGSCTPI